MDRATRENTAAVKNIFFIYRKVEQGANLVYLSLNRKWKPRFCVGQNDKMPEIRQAGIPDIPIIRAITMQVWPQTYIPIVGEGQVAYMLGRFYTPEALEKQMTEYKHRFTIGYDGDKPVAFASWGEVAMESGERERSVGIVCKLHKLYISTDVQGRGFGRAMVDRVVSDVREYGAQRLRLNVNIYNTPAINFYEKYGFRKAYDEDIDIGNGFFMNDHVYEMEVG